MKDVCTWLVGRTVMKLHILYLIWGNWVPSNLSLFLTEPLCSILQVSLWKRLKMWGWQDNCGVHHQHWLWHLQGSSQKIKRQQENILKMYFPSHNEAALSANIAEMTPLLAHIVLVSKHSPTPSSLFFKYVLLVVPFVELSDSSHAACYIPFPATHT